MKTKFLHLKRFLIDKLGLGCWVCYRRDCIYKRWVNNCNCWKEKYENED